VILFGAIVVAVLPQWRMGMSDRGEEPGAPFFLALRLIEGLYHEQAAGKSPNTVWLAKSCAIADEHTERALERMLREGWVCRVEAGGWMLGRDLATLRVLDVYRAFVLSDRALLTAQSGVAREAARLLQSGDERLTVSVRALIESVAMTAQAGATSSADSVLSAHTRPAQ
jgi:DNA-binding IscR family transcriptional regulator